MKFENPPVMNNKERIAELAGQEIEKIRKNMGDLIVLGAAPASKAEYVQAVSDAVEKQMKEAKQTVDRSEIEEVVTELCEDAGLGLK